MFNRPAITELIDRIKSDVLSRVEDEDVLRHSDSRVLAKVLAGMAHGLYGYLEYIALQILPHTATDTLEKHGSLKNVKQKAAGKATGSLTATTTVDAVIVVGTIWRRADGAQYEVISEVTATGVTTEVDVRAVVAGEDGNLDVGTKLNLLQPIAGVTVQAVAGLISGGADIEPKEDFRGRILEKWRKPPQGGALNDYEIWAKEVEGVTRAWCYPLALGPGTVTVRFMRDYDDNPIPDAQEVAKVQEYIEALRPVTAQLTVVPPVAYPVTFQISGLNPATASVKNAVEIALRALIQREAEPGQPLLVSHIREAVSLAVDEYDHALVSPAANVAPPVGEIATFEGITWL